MSGRRRRIAQWVFISNCCAVNLRLSGKYLLLQIDAFSYTSEREMIGAELTRSTNLLFCVATWAKLIEMTALFLLGKCFPTFPETYEQQTILY